MVRLPDARRLMSVVKQNLECVPKAFGTLAEGDTSGS